MAGLALPTARETRDYLAQGEQGLVDLYAFLECRPLVAREACPLAACQVHQLQSARNDPAALCVHALDGEREQAVRPAGGGIQVVRGHYLVLQACVEVRQDLLRGITGVCVQILHVEIIVPTPTHLQAWAVGLQLRGVQQVIDLLLVDLQVGAVDRVLDIAWGAFDFFEQGPDRTRNYADLVTFLSGGYLDGGLQRGVVVALHCEGLT